MYAIVDIETTGGSPHSEKITEIAILLYDGKKITHEYSTLINPEREIPYFITALTGISNEMVATAPKFYEVAKEIVELTQDKIFVAHNSNFDYSFIRSEFRQLGYAFKRDQLCTVRLSRKLIPGLKSYSLGKLCANLNIHIQNRHRAAGDALATARLFDYLIRLEKSSQLFENKEDILFRGLHPDFDKKQVLSIPEETGVYYFLNERNEVIYVGKSRNLHKRILSHLSNNSSRRAIQMKENIVTVSVEITGSELIALLKESDEIKHIKPLYNRAQRWSLFTYGLYAYTNVNGYTCFKIDKNTEKSGLPITCFKSLKEAREEMYRQVQINKLCQKLSGLYESAGACFYYPMNDCNGACIQKESPDAYNQRAQNVFKAFSYDRENFYIIDKGRNYEEKSVVKIENGRYIGFGFFPVYANIQDLSGFDEYIKHYNDNRDIQRIIISYLKHKKIEKIIRF
ncbi:MAG: GIY-YIG nuclease family protein [Bacteroidales bacterium]|nr:GIY-YIG nuclease family protein [Bacteroidales bacterium]MBN2764277.1 GIY-YIG nuclease family protein [Bacteroidales bacterium]